MPYKFVDCLVSESYAYKPRDVITGDEEHFSPAMIERLLERGIIVEVEAASVIRAPEVQKATSRQRKRAEKAVL